MAGYSKVRTIYTIGHSTRELADVEATLSVFGVRTLMDIRSFPGSRYCPQWNTENIEMNSINYTHNRFLGGKRRDIHGEGNEAWRNKSFRNYADYMQTEEFLLGMRLLETYASRVGPVAIMCSEAVPWKCHRSLVTDALLIRDWNVQHIIGVKATDAKLTSFAAVDGLSVTYPLVSEEANHGC